MSSLLYIQASPRGKRSRSSAVADSFIEAYKKKHRKDKIETINLFKINMPAFTGSTLQAKYAILHGKQPTKRQQLVWKKVEQLIEQFMQADKYVFAVPMQNFSIPYRLKQYIDVIVQPGYTFAYTDEKGYKGKVLNRPAVAFYARGGDYTSSSWAQGCDMQKNYLELILSFIGFGRIRSIVCEPMLEAGPEVAKEKLAEAIKKAKKLAESF